MQVPSPEKENSQYDTLDEDDLSFYTPIKTTPKSTNKNVLLPSTRKNLHQSQIDRAYASQIEANGFLQKIIEQNDKIIEQNDKIIQQNDNAAHNFNEFFSFLKQAR